MTLFSRIVKKLRSLFGAKYPLYGNCHICGKRVYLPFRCGYCGKFFCSTHRLPFNHKCKHIDRYNDSPAPSGVVTESKGGKLIVRK